MIHRKTQDEQNELLMALRDQGVKISSEATATAGDGITYSISLTGSAADKFTATLKTGTKDTFEIKDKEGTTIGTLKAEGSNLTAGTAGTSSASVVATDITAARATQATAKYYDKDGNALPANALSSYFTTDAAGTTSARADAPQVYDAVGNKTTLATGDVNALQDLTADLTVKLHVGADATANNQISISIASMSAKGLGVNGLKVDGTDDANALSAIDTIKQSIQIVSDQRSALGAVQNRLEHTISNLDNVVENTTSAESRIRDTDMAEEMVNYSKNNILQQAGQSMLAQANQANQGVLSLLQ